MYNSKKRWKSRNRNKKEIIDEINEFHKYWWKEVVLTWVNVSAWWASNTRNSKESKFSHLLRDILNYTNIPRIRISSISPEFLDDYFFDVIENKRIMPFFHFSVQSFSDKVLKNMNRNYTSCELIEKIETIRSLKRDDKDLINLGADIIVWFPQETYEDFLITYNMLEKYFFTNMHIFPFSSHIKWDSVPASLYKGKIDDSIKNQREKKLFNLSEINQKKFKKINKWKKLNVLFEYQKKWTWYWWSENYIQIKKLLMMICQENCKRLFLNNYYFLQFV